METKKLKLREFETSFSIELKKDFWEEFGIDLTLNGDYESGKIQSLKHYKKKENRD